MSYQVKLLTPSHYRVASALFAEFAVVLIITLFAAQEPILLLRSGLFAIVLLYLSVKADQLSQ